LALLLLFNRRGRPPKCHPTYTPHPVFIYIKKLNYEEDPMYRKREGELIQQFLQKHGHLPPGNEEVDDLF